eukprot:gene27210-46102_t
MLTDSTEDVADQPANITGSGAPTAFGLGSQRLQSLFDGFARLSRWRFAGGRARFASTMMGTGWYNEG